NAVTRSARNSPATAPLERSGPADDGTTTAPHPSQIMDIDDLRDRIWDYLFETKSPQPIAKLAALAECDETAIRLAVNHEWFAVADGHVSIAYGPSSISQH